MENTDRTTITVETSIHAPIEKVWEYWNMPEHITKWNSASPDWHTPSASNDLRVGGKFSCRMEAKDGSMGFDFSGVYDAVVHGEYLEYTLEDDRKVSVRFSKLGGNCLVVESFEAENENSPELQKTGWQAILDNFKKYTEEN